MAACPVNGLLHCAGVVLLTGICLMHAVSVQFASEVRP